MVVVAATFSVSNTGCSDPVEPTPTDTTDTTDTADPIVNSFTIGFDQYDLNLIESETFGVYNTAADRVYIYVSGNDSKNGFADFNIEIPNDSLGTYDTRNGAVFEVGTGTKGDVRREEFSADNSTLTVVLTEYGAVGEKIKGTFSGTVMRGIQSVQIKNGKFEVTRIDDE